MKNTKKIIYISLSTLLLTTSLVGCNDKTQTNVKDIDNNTSIALSNENSPQLRMAIPNDLDNNSFMTTEEYNKYLINKYNLKEKEVVIKKHENGMNSNYFYYTIGDNINLDLHFKEVETKTQLHNVLNTIDFNGFSMKIDENSLTELLNKIDNNVQMLNNELGLRTNKDFHLNNWKDYIPQIINICNSEKFSTDEKNEQLNVILKLISSNYDNSLQQMLKGYDYNYNQENIIMPNIILKDNELFISINYNVLSDLHINNMSIEQYHMTNRTIENYISQSEFTTFYYNNPNDFTDDSIEETYVETPEEFEIVDDIHKNPYIITYDNLEYRETLYEQDLRQESIINYANTYINTFKEKNLPIKIFNRKEDNIFYSTFAIDYSIFETLRVEFALNKDKVEEIIISASFDDESKYKNTSLFKEELDNILNLLVDTNTLPKEIYNVSINETFEKDNVTAAINDDLWYILHIK